jgi:hypothetical protein
VHHNILTYVRLGSKPEVTPFKRQVRFTLRSRHRQAAAVCPFRAANSGHRVE